MTTTDLGPRVVISDRAARAIFGEVRRWVEEGLRTAGAPHESLLYPLAAMVPARAPCCPLELAALDQIETIVVDDVAIPPDEVKEFGPANCRFAADDMVRANLVFNQSIDRVLARRPRLAVLSKLHAHPFVGGDFLSAGDLYHGVSSSKAVTWRERRGLATALLHVVYPDEHPVLSAARWENDTEGARARGKGRQVLWRIRTWGLGADGGMVDLGDAAIVPDNHRAVAAARRPPYWATRSGARWCDAQKHDLRAAGLEVSRNLLGRGWRRYLVTAGGRQLVLALPPDLPACPPRALEIADATANAFHVLDLPRWVSAATSLTDVSLVRLTRHYF